jgi:hypothetical protein
VSRASEEIRGAHYARTIFSSMSRRNVVWLITLPLAIVGSQVAHAAGYRLATGEDEFAHALASSGHGYLAYAPLAFGICAAFVVLALARELVALRGHERASRPSALVFSALAPAIFVAQEHFERLAHDGAFPTSLLVEKTFLLGLALQVPFALVAYALARLLLKATRAVAQLLASLRVVVLRKRSRWEHDDLWSPTGVATGLRFGPRGPPSALVV